jgi:hypothetical protein
LTRDRLKSAKTGFVVLAALGLASRSERGVQSVVQSATSSCASPLHLNEKCDSSSAVVVVLAGGFGDVRDPGSSGGPPAGSPRCAFQELGSYVRSAGKILGQRHERKRLVLCHCSNQHVQASLRAGYLPHRLDPHSVRGRHQARKPVRIPFTEFLSRRSEPRDRFCNGQRSELLYAFFHRKCDKTCIRHLGLAILAKEVRLGQMLLVHGCCRNTNDRLLWRIEETEAK